jgi:hypothetical protein
MDLGPATRKALSMWLGMDTWASCHPCDMERFYCFMDALRHDVGLEGVDEEMLMDAMRQTLRERGSQGESEWTDQELRKFKGDLITIFDFLRSCRKRGTL